MGRFIIDQKILGIVALDISGGTRVVKGAGLRTLWHRPFEGSNPFLRIIILEKSRESKTKETEPREVIKLEGQRSIDDF